MELSNGYNLTIVGGNATVLCTYPTGEVQINRFDHTLITDITFRDCSRNSFGYHGMYLRVSNVFFIGITHGGAGFEAENVLMTNIHTYRDSGLSVGSACRNFTIEDSLFENTGVFQLYTTPMVTIRTCTFSNSRILLEGSGAVTILDTNFNNGGSVTSSSLASLHIAGCNFTNGRQTIGIAQTGRTDTLTTLVNNNFYYNTGTAGGAINAQGHVIVMNCNFVGNRAQRGGAIYLIGFSLTITDSTFTSNTASESGGAIHAANVAPVLIRTRFINNTAEDNGGSIYLIRNADAVTGLSVFQSYFYNSTATSGEGGVIFTDANHANISLTESTFTFNSAPSCGVVNVENLNHHVNFTRCTFTNNEATGATQGGGVGCISNAAILLISCHFNHNTAQGDAGALSIEESIITIRDSTFHNNSAADDGGVLFTNSYPSTYDIQESTFDQNTAGSDGGVIFVGRANSRLSISTCVLTNNYATDRGGVIAIIATTLHMNESTLCNNTAELGPVISTCNSQVTVPTDLSSITDPSVPVCVLFDGCITADQSGASSSETYYGPSTDTNPDSPQTMEAVTSQVNSMMGTDPNIPQEPASQTDDVMVTTKSRPTVEYYAVTTQLQGAETDPVFPQMTDVQDTMTQRGETDPSFPQTKDTVTSVLTESEGEYV